MITTLCYLEKDNKYLMLHRTKKENDRIEPYFNDMLNIYFYLFN